MPNGEKERPHLRAPNGAGVSVLACFDDWRGVASGMRLSVAEVVSLTGVPSATVEEQLKRLTKQGYLETVAGRCYRLSRQMPGGSEISATSLRSSQTRPRHRAHEDDPDADAAA